MKSILTHCEAPKKRPFIPFANSKTAILTHLESLNFDFNEFLQFKKAEIYLFAKFRAPEMAKMVILGLLNSLLLISFHVKSE